MPFCNVREVERRYRCRLEPHSAELGYGKIIAQTAFIHMLCRAGRIKMTQVTQGKINSGSQVPGGAGTRPSGAQSPPSTSALGVLLGGSPSSRDTGLLEPGCSPGQSWEWDSRLDPSFGFPSGEVGHGDEDDTKLGAVGGMPDVGATNIHIWKELDRRQKWAGRNILRFNTEK